MTVFREPKHRKNVRTASRPLKILGAALLGGAAGLGTHALQVKPPLSEKEAQALYAKAPVSVFPTELWEQNRAFLDSKELDRIRYRDPKGNLKEFRFTSHGIQYPIELFSILPKEGKERLSSTIDAFVKRNMGNPLLFVEMAKQMQGDREFAKLKNDSARVSYFIWRRLPISMWKGSFSRPELRSLYHSMHYISPSVFQAIEQKTPAGKGWYALGGAAAGAAVGVALVRKRKGRNPASQSGFVRFTVSTQKRSMKVFPRNPRVIGRPRFPSLRGRRPR